MANKENFSGCTVSSPSCKCFEKLSKVEFELIESKSVYVTFKKGEILFDDDKIIINDDARKLKWIVTLMILLPAIYAILTFLKSYKSGDQFDFWYGLLFSLLCIPLLTLLLLRSVRSEISLSDVKSMKIKQRFRNKYLDIKLNSNRLRRVNDLQNAEQLEKYIETNLNTK